MIILNTTDDCFLHTVLNIIKYLEKKMTQKYYAILDRKDDVKVITNSHQELVEVMTVFGRNCIYAPVTKNCAQRMRQSQVSKLDKLLTVE